MMVMIKRLAIAALSMALLLAAHLSVYAGVVEVPAEAPQDAEGQEGPVYYTIIKGDTLWGISESFLTDPFRWPKIWRLNPYIKNPHLIYPGNVVKITADGIEVISAREAAAEGLPVTALEPEAENVVVLEPTGEEAVKPEGPKIESYAMARQGFISEEELKASGAIVAAKEEKLLMSRDDAAYLSFKDRSDIKQGDRFTVFSVGDRVIHPVTRKRMGYLIDILGSVRVTSTGDVVEGNIDVAYKEMQKGAKLKPYSTPVTAIAITRPGTDVTGVVLSGLEGKVELASGDIVYIDRGTRNGVAAGNLMRVFRKNVKEPDPMAPGREITLPFIDLGTLIVVEAKEETSACVIIESLKSINAGDFVGTLIPE